MRRWTKLALCVLALGIIAAPAPAQKILGDSSVGYNLYAHNWHTLQNGVGNYVFFFGNGLFGGTPIAFDGIRQCWNGHYFRGSVESVDNAAYLSAWQMWNIPASGTGVGYQVFLGPSVHISVASTGTGSDFCIAPYTANTYYLLGGFGFGGAWTGAVGPFAWLFNIRFVKGGMGQGSRGIGIPMRATFNNGTTILADMVYELQHGYNASGNNMMYLGTVSIDQLTWPGSGGIAGGDPTYGSNEWGGVFNNGTVVSATRVFDVFFTNNGGFVNILAYPGQSAEGNYDGYETMMALACDHAVLMMGRNAGEVALPNGSGGHYYGVGGNNWTGCATSTALGSGTNKFQMRAQDLFYSQLSSPLSVNNDPSTDQSVEIKWSLTAPGVAFNTSGAGAARPLDGAVLPLDHGMAFDAITNAFDNNGKAQANIKFIDDHLYDNTTSPLGLPVIFEGNWISDGEQHPTGTYTLERGRPFGPSQFGVLSLCHPKAQAQIVVPRIFYTSGIMRSAAAGTNPTGAGWVSHETTTVERSPVF